MNKLRTHTTLLVWLLVASFWGPQWVHNAHKALAHHHFLVCTAKGELHYHLSGDHCPLCQFVFAMQLPGKAPQISRTGQSLAITSMQWPEPVWRQTTAPAYQLRAPPLAPAHSSL